MHHRQAILSKKKYQGTIILGRPRPRTPTGTQMERPSLLVQESKGSMPPPLGVQEESSQLESVPNFRDLAWVDARIQPGTHCAACMPYDNTAEHYCPPTARVPQSAVFLMPDK